MKWLVIIFGIMITVILSTMAMGMNPTITIVGEGIVTVSADTATISVYVGAAMKIRRRPGGSPGKNGPGNRCAQGSRRQR